MKVLPACMYKCHAYAWYVCRSEEENRAHRNGTTDGSGPSWESNLVLLQGEKVL